MSFLKERTVVQIQMYGLGHICSKTIYGPIQLAVALKLAEKFKRHYPELSMFSQEPFMLPAEIDYLKSLNVTVFDGEKFCPSRILNPKNVSNPVIIVYCIHFPPEAFEGFLEAHWNAKLLSQIIFVSNQWPNFPWGEKSFRYSKWCKSLPIVENHPAYCVTYEERRNWSAFCGTNVHTISYENAKHMIN
uniref:SRR1-like domain-containing protein n=1 Tax=Panagrolaimus davidi TaxID=227884 RepID=A0A914R4Z5_9BILA